MRQHVTLLALVLGICLGIHTHPLAGQAASPPSFRILLSTGPFGLPPEAQSVDWIVLNDAPDTQMVQITAWRLNADAPKAKLDAGTLTIRIPPGGIMRSPNSINSTAAFYPGYFYELTVAINDRRVLPTVELSSDRRAHVLPGTRIGPTDFFELRP